MTMRTLVARIFCVAVVVLASAVPGAAQQKQPAMPPGMTPEVMKMMNTPLKGHAHGMPSDVSPVGGCIPAMGYHYVNSKNWPAGPIYGYYNGKPVFTEYMPSKKAFDAGLNVDNVLKPLPGYHIDHVDIWYETNGHPGYATPHYDIHAWYVPHSEHMKFCKNASGKRPVFV
jgi:hypothetical protein